MKDKTLTIAVMRSEPGFPNVLESLNNNKSCTDSEEFVTFWKSLGVSAEKEVGSGR